MISRSIYVWLVSAHPRQFRERFSQEIISIFDESAGSTPVPSLLSSMAFSLVRQWARVVISGYSSPASRKIEGQNAYLYLTAVDVCSIPALSFCGFLLFAVLGLHSAMHLPQLTSHKVNSVVTVTMH